MDILLNGITQSVSPMRLSQHPLDHANKRAYTSTIDRPVSVPGCLRLQSYENRAANPSFLGRCPDPISYFANKPVNPSMRPFTALAFSDPAGQAPALAQGQGRARPPRGLLAIR